MFGTRHLCNLVKVRATAFYWFKIHHMRPYLDNAKNPVVKFNYTYLLMLRRSKVIGTLSISTLICWIMKFTLYSTKGNDIYTIYTAERET